MPQSLDLVGTVASAAILGLDRSTLSRWVKEGRMPEPIMRLTGKRGACLWERATIERFRDELIELEEAAKREVLAS